MKTGGRFERAFWVGGLAAQIATGAALVVTPGWAQSGPAEGAGSAQHGVSGSALTPALGASSAAPAPPAEPAVPSEPAVEASGEPSGAESDALGPAGSEEAAEEQVPRGEAAAGEPAPAAIPEAQESSPPPAVGDAPSAAAIEVPTLESESTQRPSRAGPFAEGSVRVGGSLGWASSFGGGESTSWLILGLGAGYFPIDGLEVHGDVTTWIGDPFIATLTPGVRYVFYQVPTVKPYLGVMYRHYFVGGSLPDTDSVGARVGINFMLSPQSYFGGGVMVEHFLDQDLFSETPQVYPELVFSLML